MVLVSMRKIEVEKRHCKVHTGPRSIAFATLLCRQHLLVTNGADIHNKDNRGWKTRHAAKHHGLSQFVNYLILQGADVNTNANDVTTPSRCHCKSEHFVIEHGANVNDQGNVGVTPLHLVCWTVMGDEAGYIPSVAAQMCECFLIMEPR